MALKNVVISLYGASTKQREIRSAKVSAMQGKVILSKREYPGNSNTPRQLQDNRSCTSSASLQPEDEAITHIVLEGAGAGVTTAVSLSDATETGAAPSTWVVTSAWLDACILHKKRVPEAPFVCNRRPGESAGAGAGAVTGAEDICSIRGGDLKRRRVITTPTHRKWVQLGDLRLAAVGFGCLAISVGYPCAPPGERAVRAMLRAAAEALLPYSLLVDTADTYCDPHTEVHGNERLLAEVQRDLQSRHCRDEEEEEKKKEEDELENCTDTSAALTASSSVGGASITISTKWGMRRISSDSRGWCPGPTSPASVREGIIAARRALGLEPGQRRIFLWSLHHAEAFATPGVLEAALHEAAACVREGLVEHIGLCNASVALLERANACGAVRIATVQNEWNVFGSEGSRAHTHEVLSWCSRNKVLFVAHSPLGGLKTRRGERKSLGEHVPAIAKLAVAKGVSPHVIALGAMLHRGRELGTDVLLLVGARRETNILDSIGATEISLSQEETALVLGNILY
jgi:aryl-alcohol dehydrogenase-like predicted oxidoreductase